MIPICIPHLNQKVIDAVVETLKSGWIGQTPTVTEFEDKFKSMYGYRHALAVYSCTASLRMALHLAGVELNDEVVTTPNTFIATNTVILEQHAKPVFADIKYETGNIDPDSIMDKITEKTKAIMIVHWMGLPCDLDEIYKTADYFAIPVIEDAAQSIGAIFDGKHVGNREYGCFSFQVVKQITSGDGGMFTTNNDEIYEKAVKASWFGFTKKDRSESARTGECSYDIPELGFKYRMNAINASMGLAQLDYIQYLLFLRNYWNIQYRKRLKNVDGIELFETDERKISSCYMFPVHVERRKDFLKHMRKNGIEAFVHNYRNDRFSVFGGQQDLPNMARFDESYVCLPLHHEITQDKFDYIIKTIKKGW